MQELREGPFEIQLQDVSRVYGKRTVVDGVNLSVKQGEVVRRLSSAPIRQRSPTDLEAGQYFH